jgi:mitochondrial fission protein ELM1
MQGLAEPLTIWAVTTGEAGMRAQAVGLANRIGGEVIEKTVGLRAPWRWAPPGVMPWPLLGQDPALDVLAPPWPDLLISCGRRAASLAIGVRRAARGRTLTVHIQDPRANLHEFDLVIAMAHDAARGSGVLTVATALHGVTPARLKAEGKAWSTRLKHLPRPLAGVLLGGSTHQQPFTLDQARRLTEGLKRLRAAGFGLAVTPSRRTPPEVLALVTGAFAGDAGVMVWDRQGENPYFGILALSDRLIVTSDSVSMISEALAAPAMVEVFDAEVPRHQRFLKPLLERGYVRLFTGEPKAPDLVRAPDANEEAEAAVRRLLQTRIGLSG